MTDLRLVVFDVDGTLVDSQEHILASMTLGFSRLGLAMPSREKALSVVGLSLPEAMAILAPEASPEDQAALIEGYRSGYLAQRSERPQQLYPGIRELIDRLVERPEVLLGIATGKSRRGLDHLLESHAMTRCFISTQVADDHPSKPNPSMLLRILRETGMEAGQAVMVGDTEFDIEMGRAAGYRTIAVTWGYHPAARLRAAGADLLVDETSDLLSAIEELWRA